MAISDLLWKELCQHIRAPRTVLLSALDCWPEQEIPEHSQAILSQPLDPDNCNGVNIKLEQDILECEAKKHHLRSITKDALRSITTNKASRSDGILVELFQILKHDAIKVLHSICQQIWKTHQWPKGWKRSVFIPTPKKGNAKECSHSLTIALISPNSKVILKIL